MLAGFTKVELIQEPIASALAAGWTASEGSGFWLVYDLGGGTFDASLLETRDGMLRVVGHDGDNFLGGRDFDWAIVDWLARRDLEARGRQDQPRRRQVGQCHPQAQACAEEAKIELTRSDHRRAQRPRVHRARRPHHRSTLTLTAAKLEQLTAPLVAALDRGLSPTAGRAAKPAPCRGLSWSVARR
jgi:molecular chaperone DnaK